MRGQTQVETARWVAEASHRWTPPRSSSLASAPIDLDLR